MIDLFTCEHPKSLSDLRDKQLSTIKPNSLSVKFRHHDRSKVCKFFALFASDKVVCWPTWIKPNVKDTQKMNQHNYILAGCNSYNANRKPDNGNIILK